MADYESGDPRADDWKEYYDDIRRETKDYLDSVTDADFAPPSAASPEQVANGLSGQSSEAGSGGEKQSRLANVRPGEHISVDALPYDLTDGSPLGVLMPYEDILVLDVRPSPFEGQSLICYADSVDGRQDWLVTNSNQTVTQDGIFENCEAVDIKEVPVIRSRSLAEAFDEHEATFMVTGRIPTFDRSSVNDPTTVTGRILDSGERLSTESYRIRMDTDEGRVLLDVSTKAGVRPVKEWQTEPFKSLLDQTLEAGAIEVGTEVSWGYGRGYNGTIEKIQRNHRIGLDVTVRHDHGGVDTLHSLPYDLETYFDTADRKAQPKLTAPRQIEDIRAGDVIVNQRQERCAVVEHWSNNDRAYMAVEPFISEGRRVGVNLPAGTYVQVEQTPRDVATSTDPTPAQTRIYTAYIRENTGEPRFEEGDTVTIYGNYDLICGDALESGELSDEVLRETKTGERLEVVSIEWEGNEIQYNLRDEEGNRVWEVREDDLGSRPVAFQSTRTQLPKAVEPDTTTIDTLHLVEAPGMDYL